MTTLNQTAKLENSPVHLNNRYRPRATGIGYGNSSGYASVRQYAKPASIEPVRVR